MRISFECSLRRGLSCELGGGPVLTRRSKPEEKAFHWTRIQEAVASRLYKYSNHENSKARQLSKEENSKEFYKRGVIQGSDHEREQESFFV